ncbi:CoA-disulfide reductase [Jeotgalicoccus huakuii]|nr:CoA-disulfide reductase [Jeotgalicoccus huakuii]
MVKIAVVGGVAGGATVASQLRRLDPKADITIYERNNEISYGACGMPYHISGEVKSRKSLINMTPEKFLDKDIKVLINHEVTKVDSDNNTLTVFDKNNNDYKTVNYDYLILSPGGSPKVLPALKDVPQSFPLHKIQDLDAIMAYIDKYNIKEAVLVGSGYIGLEVTENLSERGIKVTMLQHDERIYKKIEADMNHVIHQAMEDHQIDLKLNAEIKSVEGETLTLNNGEEIHAPLIISGIGTQPNTAFLKGSGINLTDKGLIPIDSKGRTNLDNVYALGDVIETVYQHVPDVKVQSLLAWPAHRLAHIIANQIAGDDNIVHEGLLGTNIVKFFDYAIASTGLSEKEVMKFPHLVVDQKQKNKSGYMSTAKPIDIRVYFHKETHQILRAAIVGTEGVDKRIDVLATHIRLGGNVFDLINIEIAYAPPFSSPKDVINMVGYKAIAKANEAQ